MTTKLRSVIDVLQAAGTARANERRIIRELLSWRYHAQVLGGPKLRAAMIAEIRALALLYPE